MKITQVKYEAPKSKDSALKLAAYIAGQVEVYQGRRTNMISNKKATEEKILRLQKTLADIDKQISAVNTNESNWKQQLSLLQTQFSLTEAEILETKSEILRKKITTLQENAGVQSTGESTLIGGTENTK